MTQIFYRANLGDTAFPMVSEFQGRTIIQPGLDQHYMQSPNLGQGEKDRGIPEAYYLHNVMPSLQGYKSVSYNPTVEAITGITDINRIFPIKDFAGNRGHIATSASGHTYIITSDHPDWLDITPAGQPANGDVTVASATGTSFICYDSWGIFTIDLVARSLTPASITWDSPLTNASIKGIGTSNNYLLAHNGTTLYWSSALSVLDFRASQITGAGNGTPTGAIGAIIAISAVSIGFAIYCQGNIVVATFSGNVQYPWIFKEAPNGSGIASIDAISRSGDDASNYAWASAGIMRITLGGCTTPFSEVSDFLGGHIFEDFDTDTNVFSTQYPTSNLLVKLAFLSSRYLVVSYGITELTHALIYDEGLKRWGKVKITHVQAFDLSYKIIPLNNYLTYSDLGTHTYLDYTTTAFEDLLPSVTGAVAPDAKHQLAFIAADGSVSMAALEYGDITADAVILLGKYQVFRANLVTLQQFVLETIDSDDNDFSVKVLTSYDGKNTGLITTPYETVSASQRQYRCTATGVNHSLLIKGAFHLASLFMVFSKHGNR